LTDPERKIVRAARRGNADSNIMLAARGIIQRRMGMQSGALPMSPIAQVEPAGDNSYGGTSGDVPTRQEGGPVEAGKVYGVGEQGPETYVPSMTGPAASPGLARSPVTGEAPVAQTHGGKTFFEFAWDKLMSGESLSQQALKAFVEPEAYDPSGPMEAALGTVGARLPFARAGELGSAGGKLVQSGRPAALPKMTAAEREAFETKPHPEAKFPQYQTEYPTGKKGMVEYPGKEPDVGRVPTKASEAFMKERERVVRDIRKEQAKGAFRPYFDPAERFHADPSKYPPRQFETLDILPKKIETLNDHLKKIGAPEVRAKLQEAYQRGQTLGDTADWYAMGQWEKEYIRVLGAKKGREAFLNDFGAGMGATTSGLSPPGNLLAAHYGNILRAQGKPYPKQKWDVPYPVSPGRYGILPNLAKHERIMNAGGYKAFDVTNPKPHNFTRNLIGDLDRATMDEQMVQGMTPGKSKPAFYGEHERVLHEEAAKLGVPPAAMQDVAWFGFKGVEGKPMIHWVNEAIERTHRLTGMPRRKVVEGFIKKTIPMLGIAGIAAELESEPDQQSTQ
jgi:hypothetical protein